MLLDYKREKTILRGQSIFINSFLFGLLAVSKTWLWSEKHNSKRMPHESGNQIFLFNTLDIRYMFIFGNHFFYGVYLPKIRHRYRIVINFLGFHFNPMGKLTYLAII